MKKLPFDFPEDCDFEHINSAYELIDDYRN